MYLGVDVGGTKTLVAVLDDDGVITEKLKFPTPQNYDEFKTDLAKTVASFTTDNFLAAGVGLPGIIDRKEGVGLVFGNLGWENVPAQADVEKIAHCPVAVENDAKLAGLSEAMLLKDYSKVLYVTISTGIGLALIADRVIDPNFSDRGGNAFMLEHHDKLQTWESFASGSAFAKRFGKEAHEIDDEDTWKQIAYDISLGMIELLATLEVDIVVIGGSVGVYFDRFHEYLKADLEKLETPMLKIPPLMGAQRPGEAVVYGCYDLARQKYGKNS